MTHPTSAAPDIVSRIREKINLAAYDIRTVKGQKLLDEALASLAQLESLLAKEPVSLRNMLRAYDNGRLTSGVQNMNLLNSAQREDVMHEGGIAAVLDAAGVPYTEAMLAGGEKGENNG